MARRCRAASNSSRPEAMGNFIKCSRKMDLEFRAVSVHQFGKLSVDGFICPGDEASPVIFEVLSAARNAHDARAVPHRARAHARAARTALRQRTDESRRSGDRRE